MGLTVEEAVSRLEGLAQSCAGRSWFETDKFREEAAEILQELLSDNRLTAQDFAL